MTTLYDIPHIRAFSYVDDVALVSPSHDAARRMRNICERVVAEYGVKFNSSKSVLLVLTTITDNVNLTLNGDKILL